MRRIIGMFVYPFFTTNVTTNTDLQNERMHTAIILVYVLGNQFVKGQDFVLSTLPVVPNYCTIHLFLVKFQSGQTLF